MVCACFPFQRATLGKKMLTRKYAHFHPHRQKQRLCSLFQCLQKVLVFGRFQNILVTKRIFVAMRLPSLLFQPAAALSLKTEGKAGWLAPNSDMPCSLSHLVVNAHTSYVIKKQVKRFFTDKSKTVSHAQKSRLHEHKHKFWRTNRAFGDVL